MNPTKCRAVVHERAHDRCEVGLVGWCLGYANNVHHRRMAGRIWTPANCLLVCGSGTTGCHGWITEHKRQAMAYGWVVSNYVSAEVVHLVPVLVLTRSGRVEVLLHPSAPRYLGVAPGLRLTR